MIDEANYAKDIEAFMSGCIRLQVGPRQTEEGGGGFEAIFLEMDEGASELDERLEEVVVRAATFLEPEMFEDIVRFVELLAIEVHEIGMIGSARTTATRFIKQLLNVFGFAQS